MAQSLPQHTIFYSYQISPSQTIQITEAEADLLMDGYELMLPRHVRQEIAQQEAYEDQEFDDQEFNAFWDEPTSIDEERPHPALSFTQLDFFKPIADINEEGEFEPWMMNGHTNGFAHDDPKYKRLAINPDDAPF